MTVAEARVCGTMAVLFAAFAAWGSLIPFDFRWVPFPIALETFWRPQIYPAPSELIDAFSNFLLFFPIGLFAAGALARTRLAPQAMSLVVITAALLSTTLEFLQAFIWWRTPSIVDAVAETVGAITGVSVRRRALLPVDRIVGRWAFEWRRSTALERALVVYCAFFAALWLFPFDFTLKPDEIADKFQHQRILLVPFVASPDAATPSAWWRTLALAIPVGFASAVCMTGSSPRRRVASAFLIASAAVLALEIAQVAVFSRTTDVTLLVMALPGLAAGAAAAAVTHRYVSWRSPS